DALSFVVHGNTEDGESFWLVFCLKLNQLRNFNLAGLAPRRPEIHQHHFAFVLRDGHILAVKALDGDLCWSSIGARLVLAANSDYREHRNQRQKESLSSHEYFQTF